jgi:hypothetical protein
MQDVLNEVRDELERAMSKHPPLRSRHEAIAVVFEEIHKFWDEVRKREPDPRL